MTIRDEDKWALERHTPKWEKDIEKNYVDKAPTKYSKAVRESDVKNQKNIARKHLNEKYGNDATEKAIKEHENPYWNKK